MIFQSGSMLARYRISLFLLFLFMIYTCRGCNREFDARRGLTAHKRYCLNNITDAAATSLAKRRHDLEVLQAAKVCRREEDEAALRDRQDIRESLAEPQSVRSFILHIAVILRFCSGLRVWPKVAITPCISFVWFAKSSPPLTQKISR